MGDNHDRHLPLQRIDALLNTCVASGRTPEAKTEESLRRDWRGLANFVELVPEPLNVFLKVLRYQ